MSEKPDESATPSSAAGTPSSSGTPSPSGAGQAAEVHVVAEERAPQRTQRSGSCLGRIATGAVAAIIAFIVLANIVAPYGVNGQGMVPTLRDGQHVLVHTVRFLRFQFLPNRGDIVIYHPNDHPDTTTIGRVIAIPGDTIQVTSDSVIVNGKTLTEHYIAAGQPENLNTVPVTKLASQQYFILGDNRPGTNSDDSREFRAVSFDRIIGVAWITLP
jgi:signal peptidase I